MKSMTFNYFCSIAFLCAISLTACNNNAPTTAQTTIKDANFAAAIRAVCPTCIDEKNNLLAAAKTLELLDIGGKQIADLSGIEGFTGLKNLTTFDNPLTTIPTLPKSLTSLVCFDNQLTSLPTLHEGLTTLECYNNHLTALPTLPKSLRDFDCSKNQLNTLPTLPDSLQTLLCYNNKLKALPTLPNTLTKIICSGNAITTLPTLPTSLKSLSIDKTITCLPTKIAGLELLDDENSSITLSICQ